jgi:hypothetical protein
MQKSTQLVASHIWQSLLCMRTTAFMSVGLFLSDNRVACEQRIDSLK